MGLFNESEFAATNVVLEARFRDGQRLHERIERLGSGAIEGIRLREIKPPPTGPTTAQSGKELVLRYSDERGIGRYEIRHLFLVNGGGQGIPTGGVMAEGPSRRIA